MPAYLDTILAAHRRRAAEDPRDVDETVEQVLGALGGGVAPGPAPAPPPGPPPGSAPAPPPGPARSFTAAIDAAWGRDGMAVISEIKRRSPSKGDLDPDLDPARVAREYEEGGAACLSVLTDTEFFGGSAADLGSARAACTLPVLRKDFTVSALDICDARTMGADAVLLIVAGLSDGELASFLALSRRLALTPLVEVHDHGEMARALGAGADVIGINQRDLRTFEVDRRRALDMAGSLPTGVVAVAESGIRDGDDVAALAAAGFRAVLVGETLVRSLDRRKAIGGLLGAVR